MNALQLLDDHLVKIGNKLYPKSRVDKIYEKLSSPTPNTFYQSERVLGDISPTGEVSVAVKYPDVQNDYSLYKPQDTTLAPPIKDIGGMLKEFNNTVNDNPGLYYSRPVSYDGLRLSNKMGFKGDVGRMFVDTRRFRNSPIVNELLGYKDTERFGVEQAQILGQQYFTPGYFSGVQTRSMPQRRYSPYDLDTLHNGGYIGDDGYVYDVSGELSF